MENMDFRDFETIKEFFLFPNIIYILGVESHRKFLPFYVGQSARNTGRLGDYISAHFKASTDFKVGEAIKYFQIRGYEVLVKFKKSENGKKDEKEWYPKLKGKNFLLLNDLEGYNYKTADRNEERQKIRDFVDKIISNAEK